MKKEKRTIHIEKVTSSYTKYSFRFCLGFCFLIFSVISVAQTTLQTPGIPRLLKEVDELKMTAWVDSVFDSMTLDEHIGQLFMIVVDPKTDQGNTSRVVRYINEQKIGGILFSKGKLTDQAASTNKYQEASKTPLLISFDGEWGLSMRLEDTPKFPRNILLGAVSDNQLITNYGEEMGRQCRELGVHINFAPVLDVNNNPANPVIGTRSFGENPQKVADKGIAYAKGLEEQGVLSVGKHFPGHGDTADDSHETLPVIPHNLEHLEQTEFYPFKQFIQEGFTGIMTGHLSLPAIDASSRPTSLSPLVINGLLKNRLGFEGLTFTDALVMKGADSRGSSVCVQALLAGNDILLSPANPVSEFNAVKTAVEEGVLSVKLIEEKCIKVLKYKYVAGLNQYSPINTKGLSSRINSNYSEWLIRKLNEEGMTLLKNDQEIIPLKNLDKIRIAVLSLGADGPTEFEETLALYGKVDCYRLISNAKEKDILSVFKKLDHYDLVICGIYSTKARDYASLQNLGRSKKLILSFFTNPYSIRNFSNSIGGASGVVLGYENTTYTQNAAAQLIMGGIPAKGKLPVTIPGLFEYNTGRNTQKIRLSYQEPYEAGVSAQKLAKIDTIVWEGLSSRAYPGCQVLVAKSGVIIYNKSFGHFDYARTHPVRVTDLYDLASVTKATATLPALMKLYDQNKFGFQDNLSKYVPVLRNTDKKDITIKNALFHQSGLVSFIPFYRLLIDETSYTGPLYSSKRSLIYRIQYDNDTYMRSDYKFKPGLVSRIPKAGFDLQAARGFYIKNEFKDLVLEDIVSSRIKPDPQYVYSDLNFILLKEVVENISGKKLNELVESEFFSKLGADHTLFNPLQRFDTLCIAPTENDEFLRNQILVGFVDDEAAAMLGGVSGHAGLFSNTNDLAKLLQMYLNNGTYGGERYLSEAVCRTFTQTKSPLSRRGLGFDKPDTRNPSSSPTGERAPGSAYGHTGFTGTCFWVDPDNDLIYIFLSNRVYPYRGNRQISGSNIRSRIQDAIYEAFQ